MQKALLAAVAFVVLAMSYVSYAALTPADPALQAATATASLTLTEYKSDTFRFSFKVRESFTASEIRDESGHTTLLIQNRSGDGVQIVISPHDGDDPNAITVDDIRREIPDMEIFDAVPFEVGEGYMALAFKTDNEAFGGASSEIWFPYRGNFYQFTTYDRLTPLLDALFATWTFY